MTDTQQTSPFRLAYVPGVTPGKWARVWDERLPRTPLELLPVPDGEAIRLLGAAGADAALVRLPVDRTALSAIPLYTETTVVVIPKDHWLAAADEVAPDDLSDEIVLHPLDDVLEWTGPPGQPARERPAATADAVQLVAAGVGLLVVPQSLARLHHRRDLTYRPLAGVPQSQVALCWPEERTTDLVEEFIGIVRGRTVNSSRGRAAAKDETKARQREQPARQPKPRPAAAGGRRQRAGNGRTSGPPRGRRGRRS